MYDQHVCRETCIEICYFLQQRYGNNYDTKWTKFHPFVAIYAPHGINLNFQVANL